MTVLHTERLILRPYVPDDFQALTDALNDKDVSHNLARVPFPYHLSDAADFHSFIQSTDGHSLFCAVALKQRPAQLCGFISYEWSSAKADAELGYWYAKLLWGQGMATEAGHAMVQHAFEISGHAKLVAGCHVDNLASFHVLRKLGFSQSGTHESHSLAQNRLVPCYSLELTRQDWLQNTRRT